VHPPRTPHMAPITKPGSATAVCKMIMNVSFLAAENSLV
jgi:hypothetical protein